MAFRQGLFVTRSESANGCGTPAITLGKIPGRTKPLESAMIGMIAMEEKLVARIPHQRRPMGARMTARVIAACVAGLAAASPGWAQVTPAPPDIKLTGPHAATFMGKINPDAPPPSPDPRDLNGVYVDDLDDTSPPVAKGVVKAGLGSQAPGVQPDQCRPSFEIGAAGYGLRIMQTPGRVTFFREYNHTVRRVYLDQNFPDTIVPSYLGTSIGHWEGNTLVIETRGLRPADLARTPGFASVGGMASVIHVVEDLLKIQGGRKIQDIATVEGIDRAGQKTTVTIEAKAVWRSDVQLGEYICEETGNDFFTH